ncbi:MAG: hypothetical protein ACRYGH_07980 [Janthinobacterium lividum]
MLSFFVRILRPRFSLFCGSLVLLGCSPAPEAPPILVKGKWKTANNPPGYYLSLNFADSTVVFDTRGDTILRFAYRLDRPARAVVLTDGLKQTVSCRLLKATADSLIFANLWDSQTRLRFAKE